MIKGIDVSFPNLKSMMGRDSDCISCDIKYKGKKIAYYNDSGNGGGGFAQVYDRKFRPLLKELESEIAALEPITYMGTELKYDLDLFIGQALDDKDVLKLAKKKLVFKDSDGVEMSTYWQGYSMKQLSESKAGKDVVQKKISQFKAEGAEILCKEYYESLGFTV